MSFRHSLYRVTTRSAFLATALILALILWYLPHLLNLDAFRPALVELLETTFQCKVLVGGISAQLVPTPGVSVGHVVFLENSKTPHVLASVAYVQMSLSPMSLLKKRFVIKSIRFVKPRFIVHRELDPYGKLHWMLLQLPSTGASPDKQTIGDLQIRNGSVEIWDHTTTPTSKWISDQLTGSYQVTPQTGVMVGKAPRFGRAALLDLHYVGANRYPLQIQFNDVDIGVFQSFFHLPILSLEGLADFTMKARWTPILTIEAQLDQPQGAGQVTVSVEPGRRDSWRWSAVGIHYNAKGTVFQIPEWSAKNDGSVFAIYLRGVSVEGGMFEVGWTRPVGSTDANLEVNISSVTVRQVLEVFKKQSKIPAPVGATNLHGYESWRIDRGSMEAVMHDGMQMEVKESDVDLAGMHSDLTGTFGLAKTNTQAHIQGDLQNIPVTSVVESFFPAPSPITGTGQADYALSFPLTTDWIKGLNGTIQLEVKSGVLRALKTIYRITSVLNLGNYLRLRFPRLTAAGIEFERFAGHFTFQNGVLSSDDLFLKSPNMNVGFKGAVDMPGKRINSTLRLEMFRFLEDILRDVPLTHWIFKKPNKIFLPLVVKVEGPWDNPDID